MAKVIAVCDGDSDGFCCAGCATLCSSMFPTCGQEGNETNSSSVTGDVGADSELFDSSTPSARCSVGASVEGCSDIGADGELFGNSKSSSHSSDRWCVGASVGTVAGTGTFSLGIKMSEAIKSKSENLSGQYGSIPLL